MKNRNNRKIPVILTAEEVKKIIEQPNKRTPTGLRNKALLSLMWDSGARAGDILNIRPRNISITKREVFYENGKYGVDRDSGFSEHTADLLTRYKRIRPKRSDYFFCTLKGKQLDRVYLYNMIRRYTKRAGIDKRVGLHTIRHSFATDYLKSKDSNLATLQKILGHKNIRTTSVYLHYDKTDVINGLNRYYPQRDSNNKNTLEDKIRALEYQLKEIKGQLNP